MVANSGGGFLGFPFFVLFCFFLSRVWIGWQAERLKGNLVSSGSCFGFFCSRDSRLGGCLQWRIGERTKVGVRGREEGGW